jgi:hypothetical protein
MRNVALWDIGIFQGQLAPLRGLSLVLMFLVHGYPSECSISLTKLMGGAETALSGGPSSADRDNGLLQLCRPGR